jgi:DNA-directed RNA polymerase subunit RPC12/RpoP
MAKTPVESLHTSLKEYFNVETFSDATVTCKGRAFKVHRLILSAQSDFFAKVFTGDWKSVSRQIELEEVEVAAVEAMLRFMYHLDYNTIHGASTMIFNTQVYGLADKYIIPALKSLALEKFRMDISSGWAMDDFPLTVSEAYNSTPETDRALRDLVVEISTANINKLLENELFRGVLRETPGFAVDMVNSLSSSRQNRHKDHKSYRCPSCDHVMDGDLLGGTYYYCIHCGSRRSDWNSYGCS